MSLITNANIFSGQYGCENDVGDVLHIELNLDKPDITMDNKDLIILLDVSGSMEKSLPLIKASLLTFRDTIIQKSREELNIDKYFVDKYSIDEEFRNIINTRLITFSNHSKQIWSSKTSELTYEETIKNITTESMTNMGSGLKLAFEHINPDRYTWIVIITDGISNRGDYKTPDSFYNLIQKDKNVNSKIISLGCGNQFDSEVLRRIGTFAFAEDFDDIPMILGNIAEEIVHTWYIHCSIVFDESSVNDIILPEGYEDLLGKSILGTKTMDVICTNKTYHYGCLVPENIKNIKIKYTNISTFIETEELCNVDSIKNGVPSYIRKLHFNYEYNKFMLEIYKLLYADEYIHECVGRKIKKWGNIEECEKYKNELVLFLENLESLDANNDRLNNVFRLNSSSHIRHTALNISEGKIYSK